MKINVDKAWFPTRGIAYVWPCCGRSQSLGCTDEISARAPPVDQSDQAAKLEKVWLWSHELELRNMRDTSES